MIIFRTFADGMHSEKNHLSSSVRRQQETDKRYTLISRWRETD